MLSDWGIVLINRVFVVVDRFTLFTWHCWVDSDTIVTRARYTLVLNADRLFLFLLTVNYLPVHIYINTPTKLLKRNTGRWRSTQDSRQLLLNLFKLFSALDRELRVFLLVRYLTDNDNALLVLVVDESVGWRGVDVHAGDVALNALSAQSG
jgi:hypothetical protein